MGKQQRSEKIERAPRLQEKRAAELNSPDTGSEGGGFAAELARLEQLSLDDLRLYWRNQWGRLAPAPLTRGLLFRLMAYRLQAQMNGDLDPTTVRLLARLAKNAWAKQKETSEQIPADNSAVGALPDRKTSALLILKPGALLTREWRGCVERAIVVSDGFAWSGMTYPSLSAVAFAITGTKWNGHRFFGVRAEDRARAARVDRTNAMPGERNL